jgi:hypothetical protein
VLRNLMAKGSPNSLVKLPDSSTTVKQPGFGVGASRWKRPSKTVLQALIQDLKVDPCRQRVVASRPDFV